MGYIAHDAVIAVVSDYDPHTIEAIETFRAGLGDDARFLVGPVLGTNGNNAYAFLPDGSKEGWDTSDRIGEARAAFALLARGVRHGDGSGSGDVVHVRFGGDYGLESGTTIESTTDRGG